MKNLRPLSLLPARTCWWWVLDIWADEWPSSGEKKCPKLRQQGMKRTKEVKGCGLKTLRSLRFQVEFVCFCFMFLAVESTT